MSAVPNPDLSSLNNDASVQEVWSVLGISQDDLNKLEKLKELETLVKAGKMKPEVYAEVLATTKQQLQVSKLGKKAVKQLAKEQQKKATRIEVPPGKPIVAGYLFKRPKNSTTKIVVRWKRRFFALYKHCLIYYKNQNDTVPKGMLQLNADFFVAEPSGKDQQKGDAFVISDMTNKFYLGANSPEEKTFWMHTITRVLRKLQEDAAYFDAPVLMNQPTRTAEQIQKDYESRMAAYKASQRKKAPKKSFWGTLKKKKGENAKQEAELDERAQAEAIARGARELEAEEHEFVSNVEKRQTARAKELQRAKETAILWKKRAEEAAARAAEEFERAESEHEAAKLAKQQLQDTLAELRSQAREREEALIAERDEVKAKLGEAMKRRKSYAAGTLDKKKFLEFEKERKALQAKLDALQSALHVDLDGLDWDGTLEDAEAKMRALVPVLSSDDPKKAQDAQAEFDQWDKIIRNHGDYIQREKDKWTKWEEENKSKNLKALEEMRALVPPRLVSGMTLEELTANKNVYPGTARRILKTQILKFLYMSKEDIAKIHVADLSSRYVPQGLDIVELRAVYTRVPDEFQNDRDGKKQIWLDNIRAKLFDFTTREEKGQLTNPEKRNPAYFAPGKAPRSNGPPRTRPQPRPSGSSKKFGISRGKPRGGGGKNQANVKIGAKKIDTSALQAALQAKLMGGGPPPAVRGGGNNDNEDSAPPMMGGPFGGGKIPAAVLESRRRMEEAAAGGSSSKPASSSSSSPTAAHSSRRPKAQETGGNFFARAASLLSPTTVESDEDEPAAKGGGSNSKSDRSRNRREKQSEPKTKSQARAAAFGNGVEANIEELLQILRKNGVQDKAEGGVATMTFGDLFEIYEDVNDILVGLLLRAKKHKKIGYVGDILFRGIHDNVKITLLS